MSTTRNTITGSPTATLRQRRPSLHRSVASQIKQQRRSYARAVLRSLARTHHGQPTVQVPGSCVRHSDLLVSASPRQRCTSSPQTSAPDAPST